MDAVKRNQGQEGPRRGAKNDRGGTHLPSLLAPTCVAYVQFDAQLPLPQQNMEKFKVCEKEMKTKAFSKEGLQQAALAKDEDPNTETKKWYGYLSSHSVPFFLQQQQCYLVDDEGAVVQQTHTSALLLLETGSASA
jgi:hypothetical protein